MTRSILTSYVLLIRNTVLFRCDQEERDANGGGVYVLDGYPLCYAGLQGVISLLSEIRPINDMGNWYDVINVSFSIAVVLNICHDAAHFSDKNMAHTSIQKIDICTKN